MLQMLKRAAASVANAAAGKVVLFFDSDGLPKIKDESGTVTSLKGSKGDPGNTGSPGIGVPAGGLPGQSLRKNSSADFDTVWVTSSAGSGTGDVEGPASSVTNHVALFADATGKTIKDGGVLADVAKSGSYADLSDKPEIPAARTRQSITAPVATITPAATDEVVSARGQNAAFTLANPAGTGWLDGDLILVRLKDDGTARGITWGDQYRGSGGALPAATVAGKNMLFSLVRDHIDSKWDVILPASVQS